MQLRILHIFLLAFGYVQGTQAFSFHFDAKEQEHLAEIQGYGYKTTNLILLKKPLSNQKLSRELGSIKVEVPDFIGIKSAENKTLIGENILSLKWKDAVESFTSAASLEEVLSGEKKLPDMFITSTNTIAMVIENKMTELGQNPKQITLPELIKFLKKAEKNNWRLMVRSTGKEDTDKLANAGGNYSEANVSPQLDKVLPAMGRVLASYFKERSLRQRVMAKDKTLLDFPLTPVLIQRMVGEKLGGADSLGGIPTGCVVYTEEPAGKLKGITVEQCSFGHNEGVVQSLVPLDTFYAQDGHSIKSVVKTKEQRLVPTVKDLNFSLEGRENPSALKNAPALSNEAVIAIHKVSQAVDAFYQTRQDLELVYKPDIKTIYVVQSRPLVYKARSQSPSFLTSPKQFSNRIDVLTIFPQDSAVQRIQDPLQILAAKTLEQALELYSNDPYNKYSKTQIVVVKKDVDVTSHAAATFRGDGKIIVKSDAKEFAVLKRWLGEAKPDLLFDVQRGLFVNLAGNEKSTKSLEQLFADQVLKEGWINYPIPLLLSVEQNPKCTLVDFALAFQGLKTKCLINKFDDQVDNIYRKMMSLKKKASCLGDSLDCLSEKVLADDQFEKMDAVHHHATLLRKEIKEDVQGDQKQLADLFPERFFEALLLQKSRGDVVNAYSFESLNQEYKDRYETISTYILPLVQSNKISKDILKDQKLLSMMEEGAKSALNEKLAEKWILWVASLNVHGKRTDLLSWYQTLHQLSIFPLWLNLEFTNDKEGDSNLQFGRFQKELVASKDYIGKASAIQAILNTYDPSVWANPEKYQSSLTDLTDKLSSYFTSDAFLEPKTVLEKIIFTRQLDQFIHLYDLSIKEFKASQRYASEDRAEKFKTLIASFFDCLRKIIVKAPADSIQYHENWSLTKYLDRVAELLNLKIVLSETDFVPSRDFSVAAAAIGSITEFQRHEPQNLEDFFTLVHQCLIVANGAFSSKMMEEKLDAPASFKALYQKVKDAYPTSTLAQVSLDKDTLEFKLNIPLQNHSADLRLVYKKEDKSVYANFGYLGPRRTRWDQIRDYVKIWNLSVHTRSVEFITFHDHELRFNIYNIENLEDFHILVQDLNDIANNEAISPQAIEHLEADKVNEDTLSAYIEKESMHLNFSLCFASGMLDQGKMKAFGKTMFSKMLVESSRESSCSQRLLKGLEKVQEADYMADAIRTLALAKPYSDWRFGSKVELFMGLKIASAKMQALAEDLWAQPMTEEWVSEVSSQKALALGIYKTLANSDLFLEEAERFFQSVFAEYRILDKNGKLDTTVGKDLLEFFVALASRNKAEETIEEFLAAFSKDDALLLKLPMLNAKGYGLSFTEEVLKTTDFSNEKLINILAFGIIHNKYLDEAEKFAELNPKSDLAKTLVRLLVYRGRAYKLALQMAEEDFSKIGLGFHRHIYGSALFYALFQKGQGFDEAQAIVEKIWKDDELAAKRLVALRLAKELAKANPDYLRNRFFVDQKKLETNQKSIAAYIYSLLGDFDSMASLIKDRIREITVARSTYDSLETEEFFHLMKSLKENAPLAYQEIVDDLRAQLEKLSPQDPIFLEVMYTGVSLEDQHCVDLAMDYTKQKALTTDQVSAGLILKTLLLGLGFEGDYEEFKKYKETLAAHPNFPSLNVEIFKILLALNFKPAFQDAEAIFGANQGMESDFVFPLLVNLMERDLRKDDAFKLLEKYDYHGANSHSPIDEGLLQIEALLIK